MTGSRTPFLTVIVLAALACLAGGCDRQSDNGREIALFGGGSLEGWTTVGDAEWQVADGVLTTVAGSGDGMLVSDRPYGNYRLIVEFWADEKVNSGVFIGCRDPQELTPFNCHEINIWDHHPNQDFRTGAIVAKVAPQAEVATVGQWNLYDISAGNGRVVVTLNGVVTAELFDAADAAGYIGLQSANGGTVRFRRVILQPQR